MADYIHDNGKNGIEHCWHTATGYQCVARHSGNMQGYDERILFFARHVVASNGHPYTEIGLSGLEDHERLDALFTIKQALAQSDFKEVLDLSETSKEENAFAEHTTAAPDSIAVRINAGKEGIKRVIDAMSNLMHDVAHNFIVEQEAVPNVLYESIIHSMGQEMDRGPGGHERAVKKAHDLAYTLKYGYTGEVLG